MLLFVCRKRLILRIHRAQCRRPTLHRLLDPIGTSVLRELAGRQVSDRFHRSGLPQRRAGTFRSLRPMSRSKVAVGRPAERPRPPRTVIVTLAPGDARHELFQRVGHELREGGAAWCFADHLRCAEPTTSSRPGPTCVDDAARRIACFGPKQVGRSDRQHVQRGLQASANSGDMGQRVKWTRPRRRGRCTGQGSHLLRPVAADEHCQQDAVGAMSNQQEQPQRASGRSYGRGWFHGKRSHCAAADRAFLRRYHAANAPTPTNAAAPAIR